MKITTIKELEEIKKIGLEKLMPSDKPRLSVGLATCGISVGADLVFEELKRQIEAKNLNISLTKTGCIGFCRKEPLLNIITPQKGILILHNVLPSDVSWILDKVIENSSDFDKVLCRIEKWDHIVGGVINYGKGFDDVPLWDELNFFKPQKKVVLRNAGLINPEDIDEYIAVGGYSSLFEALKRMSPAEVIEEVKKAGLRGRGGAGFPTGLKWELTRSQKSRIKYVICNGDEGDPGAYMNRNEMESDPHSIIEGMIIGGYAIGAQEGIIYVRAEYPLAYKRLEKAINEAKSYGLLGNNILNSGFDFEIAIAKGAGAFVCGEETALIASIEGDIGRPRPRPPFPSEVGLWGKPTNINNVESWANIPVIIDKKGEWFSKVGVKNNSGTKVFSLVGKITNVGLIEVELGTPIDKIIYEIGEADSESKKIKAIQTGGPSGGCIPDNLFSTSLDYDNLARIGSIMGSGGIVVMDEDTCMVDTARYFLDFTLDESCGKCVSCREGLKHMFEILNDVVEGKAQKEDIETLKELADTVKKTSLCGLGQTAPNPILTTLDFFKEEYEAHVIAKKCPAKVCKNLIKYLIDAAKCTGCTRCIRWCPVGAISGEKRKPHLIDQAKCTKCGTCLDVCRFEAVRIISEGIEEKL
jgi:NADH-quinone oxidoreductase subunit F